MQDAAEEYQVIDGLDGIVPPFATCQGVCEGHLQCFRDSLETVRDECSCHASPVRVYEVFLQDLPKYAFTGPLPQDVRDKFMLECTVVFNQDQPQQDDKGDRYVEYNDECDLDGLMSCFIDIAERCAEEHGYDLHTHWLVRCIELQIRRLGRPFDHLHTLEKKQALKRFYEAALAEFAMTTEEEFVSKTEWDDAVEDICFTQSNRFSIFAQSLGYEAF